MEKRIENAKNDPSSSPEYLKELREVALRLSQLTISTVEYAKFVKSTMDANIEADMQKSRQNGGASVLSAEEIKQLNQQVQGAKEQEAKEKEQKSQDAIKSTEGL